MSLTAITTGLPNDVLFHLMAGENVYCFSFITFKGGCGSGGQRENYWIALTERRIMYKSKIPGIKGGQESFVEQDGDLYFDKISFIEVLEEQELKHRTNTKACYLNIITAKETIAIPIPTKEKAEEIRKIYLQLSQTG